MTDLSHLSTDELQRLSAGDTSHPDNLTSMSTEELQKIAGISKPEVKQPAQSNQEAGKSVLAAGVGGLSSGGADIAEGISNTPVWLMQHLHIISPETAKKVYASNKDVLDVFRPDATGDQTDIINKGAQEHPIVNQLAKTGVDIAGAAEGAKAASVLGTGAKVLSGLLGGADVASTTAGIAGRAVGQGLVGQASVDPENKDQGFALGALMSPAVDAAGLLLSKAGSRVTATDTINAALEQNSKSKINAAYNLVKKSPFLPEDSEASSSVGKSIKDYLSANSDKLSTVQKTVLDDTADKLLNATDHVDTLQALQGLGNKSKIFAGLNASDALHSDVGNFKQAITNVIDNATTRNGTPGALEAAGVAHSQGTIINKIFGNLATDEGSFNFKSADSQLTKKITQYADVPYMKDTVETLKGLKKALQPIAQSYAPSGLASHAAGAAIGGAIGYKQGGETGAVAGSIIGGMGTGALIKSLHDLARTPQGTAILRAISKPGIHAQDIQAILKSLGTVSISNSLPKE